MAPQPQGPTPQIVYQSSFSTGMIDPALWFRSDLEKQRAGAANLNNFFVTDQGSLANRSGTQFIGECGGVTETSRLIPFQFNDSQTYILEFGYEFIRFISNGAYVEDASGNILQITSPYQQADLFNLRYAQSNDVLTITHPNYTPMDLNRVSATSWTLTPITFGEGLSAPTFVASECEAVNGEAGSAGTTPAVPTAAYVYGVSAVSSATSTESLISASVSIPNYNIGYYQQYGNYNALGWNPVTGANYYNLYRMYGGNWAFVGSTTGTSFSDTNIEPNSAQGPPLLTNPFVGNNPVAVTYFQGRRVFAGSAGFPSTLWMSKTENYTNFDQSVPTQDNDAITASINSNEADVIYHLIPVINLLIFTSGGAWQVSSGSGQSSAVSPTALDAQKQVFIGCNNLQPLVIGYDILYVASHGSHVMDLTYNYYAQLYVPTDQSSLAQALVYGYTLTDWAFARSPFNIVWMVRSDGNLLGLTYLKEQNIYAWHTHTTLSGGFSSVASVPETVYTSVEDAVYFVVERYGKFYIERLHTRLLGAANDDLSEAWFLDCALQYRNATKVSTVSGLTQFPDGTTVSAMIDGVPYAGLTVTDGAVTLPVAGSDIIVGLPITGTVQMLPVDSGQPTILGLRKRISRVMAFMSQAFGLQVAPEGATFVDLMPINSATGTVGFTSGVLQAQIPPHWDQLGQLTFRQTLPTPCTLLGVEMQIEVGAA